MSALETKPRKFFDISKDITAYLELQTEYAIENEGEISPLLEEWEKEFFAELSKKTDSVAGFIRTVEFEAEKMKVEKDFFAKKQKSLENLSGKIRKFLLGFMQYENHKVLQGDVFKIALTNNGGKIPVRIYEHVLSSIKDKTVPILTNELAVPEKFRKQVWVLDTDAIRESLEAGEVLEIATLETRGQHLRIS